MDPSAGVLFGVEDLLEVTLKGNNLEAFLAEWDRCLIHMTKPPSVELRDALFVKQVKDCPKLKTEWDNYYKADAGSETRSFEYLHKSAMLVVERERFESARNNVTKKGTDAMAAPGDGGKGSWKGKGKGKSTGGSTDADGAPWFMENGKDKRADRPCHFLASGNCRLGKDCPWKHGSKPGRGVDAAAAPTGDSTKKGERQVCRGFKENGKCRFGDKCQFSHDLPSKNQSDDKSDKRGKKKEKDGKKSSGKKEDDKKKKKKKGRAGAVAEVASGAESENDSGSGSDLSSGDESSD